MTRISLPLTTVTLNPQSLDFWAQPCPSLKLSEAGIKEGAALLEVTGMRTSLLWRMGAAPISIEPLSKTSLFSETLQTLHAMNLKRMETDDPHAESHLREEIETILPDIKSRGSLYEFLQAFEIYSRPCIGLDLSNIRSRFDCPVGAWHEISDLRRELEVCWGGPEQPDFLLDISKTCNLFTLSDRLWNLLLREVESSAISVNKKLKVIASLATNKNLTEPQILDLLRFTLAQKDQPQDPNYVVALGKIGRNRRCPSPLSHEIEMHVISCEASLAAEDQALYDLSCHPGRIESPFNKGIKDDEVAGLNLSLDEKWAMASLRERPSPSVIQSLKTALHAFHQVAPCLPEESDDLVVPVSPAWRHAQIVPTTADAYLERIAHNLDGYVRLFGEQAGLFFYRHGMLASPLEGTDAYLVMGRGWNEGNTGIEISIYPTLPFQGERGASWPDSYLVRVQCIFGEGGSLDIVNIQGFGEKRLKETNSSRFKSIRHVYQGLQDALKGMMVTDQLIALAIRLATQNGFREMRIIRDSAQKAYFESPHEGQGLYDNKANIFGFMPAQGRALFHTLNLSTASERQEQHLEESFKKTRRRGKGSAAEAYAKMFLPAWQALAFEAGLYAPQGRIIDLPEAPSIWL